MQEISVNKRIAKNTLFLYMRMFVMMIIQLYTARIVLEALGVEDFGIFNLVGGIIVLFAFINNAMSSASQRFISYSLGKRDDEIVKDTFNSSVVCHIVIAIVVLILSETFGLWLLNEKLDIPVIRQHAAFWVYQFTVLSAVVNILRVPYNAMIISYERMSFYAYSTILEALLKLLIVFLLIYFFSDKLVAYAFLLSLISVLLLGIYFIYCRCRFATCRFCRCTSLSLPKEMLSYSGWQMVSSAVTGGNQQGGNMLLNVFFGVACNAAYGIASQVSNAIYLFASNFQLAFQPQVVKQYAAGEHESLRLLVYRSSVLSYYLLLVISVPFMVEADWILGVWLGTVPLHSSLFCVLLVAYFMIDALQAPLWMVIGASGRVRNYTIWNASISVLNLPIVYLILVNGGGVIWVFLIRVLLNIVCSAIRIPYVNKFIDLQVCKYLVHVILPTALTTIVAFFAAFIIKDVTDIHSVSVVLILLSTFTVVFVVGLRKEEKAFLYNSVRRKLGRSN